MDQNQPKLTPSVVIKKKWYQKDSGIVLLLIFFFPVGIYLMWKHAKWSKTAKWIVTGCFITYVIWINSFAYSQQKTSITTSSTSVTKVTFPSPTIEVVEIKEEVKQEPTQQTETSKAETKNEPIVPPEYRSALRKANSYSSTMHMSKQGVYDQLVAEFGEKFSPEAAQYAIDNVTADWNTNALAKAKTYQDTMSMSPAAIRSQLVSSSGEKFTEAEADYAIQHLND